MCKVNIFFKRPKVIKKMMKKAIIAVLLQIVLMKDVALSELNNRDNSTQTAASANLTESTTPHSLLDVNTTISAVDNNSTESSNATTTEGTTENPLIPPATVEAQIFKVNISTKKPSRLQLVAS